MLVSHNKVCVDIAQTVEEAINLALNIIVLDELHEFLIASTVESKRKHVFAHIDLLIEDLLN